MRLSFQTLQKIQEELGDFEIGTFLSTQEGRNFTGLTLRFGYWKRKEVEKIQSILPATMEVKENLVDDDEDCGRLWDYEIHAKKI